MPRPVMGNYDGAVVSGFFVTETTVRARQLNGLHGLNPINTALVTPASKRRPALIDRLVKHTVTQVEETRPYV